MQQREYQARARDAILSEWRSVRATLLIMPTGTGKTIVFAGIAETVTREGKRVLILAHREELLQQAADKIHAVTGMRCAVEKAENDALDDENRWYMITLGSVQTLMRDNRREKFGETHYDVIIIDEAHHTLAESYRRIINHFPEAKILGVTATPDRGDLRDLGEIYESVAFEYRLPEAIQDKWLVPIRAQTIPLEIDLTAVKQQAGDYQVAGLGTALDPYLHQIAAEIAEKCRDRKTVVFLPLIATSQKFLSILQSLNVNSREVNGESTDRAETLKWFTEADRGAVLCNAMLLTEGWDEPSADCIVVLRPTKVRSLYAQMIGRGTRLFPGKDNLLLLDFLWMSQRHNLCRPAALVCDNQDLADEVARILAQEEKKGGMMLDDAVSQAESTEMIRREESLAKKLSEMKHRKRALVDPLQFEYSIGDSELARYQAAMPAELKSPTKEQIQKLEKAGIFPDEIKNYGEANLILDRISKRREAGLTTPKQIRFLESRNFKHVGKWRFEQAKKLIDRIAANRWIIPAGINPETYNYENV